MGLLRTALLGALTAMVLSLVASFLSGHGQPAPGYAPEPLAGTKIIYMSRNGLNFSAYECGRGPNKPLVVLLHGFPDNARSLQHQQRMLCEELGLWAIAPTLRGYEPTSQAPVLDYWLATLAADLLAWLDHLKVADRAHVIGHDWGAVLAYYLATQHADRFATYVTLAVPHHMLEAVKSPVALTQLRNSWYFLFFQTWILPEWLLGPGSGHVLVRKLWRDWSPGRNWDNDDHFQSVLRTFSLPGVPAASVSYYRFNLWSAFVPDSLLGEPGLRSKRGVDSDLPQGVPLLAITGVNDGCIDTRVYDYTMPTSGDSLWVRRVQNAGHFAHLEQPQEVNRLIVEFYRKHRVAGDAKPATAKTQ